MTSIVSYRKTSDAHTTYELRTPDAQGDEGEIFCAELGTLDGLTYVSVPAGVTLPEQLPQVAATLQPVTLTPGLREQLKAISPHCALISERMVQRQEDVDELKHLVGDFFVPALKVGKQSFRGFETGAYNNLLDLAGYPKTAPYGAKPSGGLAK